MLQQVNGEEIGPGAVHLWYAVSDEVSEPAQLAALESLLTPDERARRARYRFERERHQFLVARGLLRWTLSGYLGLPPEAVRFRAGPHGKPELAVGATPTPLTFNLSHAAGLVACAIARDAEIGIDVEDLAGAADIDAVARSFAPSERADLDAVREKTARQNRFLAYWTLKEAYLKARGLGLSIALDGFWFVLEARAPIAIRFAAPLDDDPTRWQFDQRDLAPGHLLAVAAAVGDGAAPLAVSVERCVPEAAA